MSDYAISLKRTGLLLAALTFTALLMVVNFASFFGQASAAQLTGRRLTLSSTLPGTEVGGGTPGVEDNGSEATHTFAFTTITADTDEVWLQYCTTALGDCDAPAGLSLASATSPDGTVSDESANIVDPGNDDLAVSIDLSTDSQAAGAKSFSLEMVDNPDYDSTPADPDSNTFFVRISTRSDTDLNVVLDDGTVASAITQGIEITARVAETLGFSTTGDFDQSDLDGVVDPGASCAALTGSGAITLGDPTNENTLSLTQAFDNYSAFRLYTNAASGVVIQYEGDTLRHSNTTSDINPILAGVGTADDSAVGLEQFGLAIDQVVGTTADVDSTSRANMDMTYVTSTANLAANGAITADGEYDLGSGTITDGGTAEFAFLTNATPASRVPDTIATTAGYTECKTLAVRYIANISPTTTSGTYTTTIVYSAVPTY